MGEALIGRAGSLSSSEGTGLSGDESRHCGEGNEMQCNSEATGVWVGIARALYGIASESSQAIHVQLCHSPFSHY
jgi:hypothetical protein